jgi:nicotinamide-nucleotide adenylyltransferase
MMDLLAREIETTGSTTALIALTKHARFVDKAKDVAASFPAAEKVVWLVGFDTLTRILDKKYYPSSLEESLGEFWERNRLVCAIRGEESVERGFVEKIREGGVDGLPSLWADYVEIIEPVGREESSTRAREAAAEGRWEEVGIVVPQEIATYIQREKLYTEES